MKLSVALLVLCLLAGTADASSPTPKDMLAAGFKTAKTLLNQEKFAEAEAALDKLAADPDIAALEEWPHIQYECARAFALAGKIDRAMAMLQKAADADTLPSPAELKKDPKLAALQADPRFQELVRALEKKLAFWNGSPALATPYKPTLSDAEKIAGLSQIWSMARYNFPFFDRLPDLDWDKLYIDYIPKVQAAKTTEAYYLVLMEFIAHLHDGHTNVYPPKEAAPALLFIPKLRTLPVEDKVLVVRIDDPALTEIRIGDEIVAIDGMKVRDYAQKTVAPYATGFSKQDFEQYLYAYRLLAGDGTKPVQLTLRHADGGTSSVTVARNGGQNFKAGVPDASFGMLPGGIAVLTVNTMRNDSGIKAMREHFAEIAAAKGLIIDVRENGGGSSKNGYAMLSLIANKPFPTSRIRSRQYNAAERAWGRLPGWKSFSDKPVAPDETLHYAGPVAVLIGPRSYSAAEDFAAAFDVMRRGNLVGEATAGSSGEPLKFALPGGGGARICTMDDTFPDGRPFEGIGVKPQIAVAPTVADVRAGKDTVLERAVLFLTTGK